MRAGLQPARSTISCARSSSPSCASNTISEVSNAFALFLGLNKKLKRLDAHWLCRRAQRVLHGLRRSAGHIQYQRPLDHERPRRLGRRRRRGKRNGGRNAGRRRHGRRFALRSGQCRVPLHALGRLRRGIAIMFKWHLYRALRF